MQQSRQSPAAGECYNNLFIWEVKLEQGSLASPGRDRRESYSHLMRACELPGLVVAADNFGEIIHEADDDHYCGAGDSHEEH